jgi:predicted outer membrane protein
VPHVRPPPSLFTFLLHLSKTAASHFGGAAASGVYSLDAEPAGGRPVLLPRPVPTSQAHARMRARELGWARHMRKTLRGCFLAGAMVFSVCSMATAMGTGGSGMPTGQSAQEMAADMPKEGATKFEGMVVPTREKDFLERLHMTHMMEIQAGKLAQTQSHSPEVKAFGQRMVEAHTQADQQLMQYAQSRGLKLAMPPKPMNGQETRMMAAEMAEMEKLAALRGEAFDPAYLSTQVAMHDSGLTKRWSDARWV